MKKEEEIHISKFLSLVLRHKPEAIGLSLDKNGWALIYDLIQKTNENNPKMNLDFEKIKYVVDRNEKQRFALTPDKTKIRANQGHSIEDIDMEFEKVEPPVILFHGTAKKNLESIKQQGLLKMNRQYVHLTSDHDLAVLTGQRHGAATVLIINAQEMWEKGHAFYLSGNNVWMTETVPPEFIVF